MIIRKRLVTVGQDYLLLFSHKVLFSDIEALCKYNYGPSGKSIEMVEVRVKDESKFPLTNMQKFAAKLGHPLFIISIGMMTHSDAQKLESLLNNIMPLQRGRNI